MSQPSRQSDAPGAARMAKSVRQRQTPEQILIGHSVKTRPHRTTRKMFPGGSVEEKRKKKKITKLLVWSPQDVAPGWNDRAGIDIDWPRSVKENVPGMAILKGQRFLRQANAELERQKRSFFEHLRYPFETIGYNRDTPMAQNRVSGGNMEICEFALN